MTTSTRKELENYVISHNVILRNVVSTMEPVILLRNCHPKYRENFALGLYHENVITKDQAKEFTKLV